MRTPEKEFLLSRRDREVRFTFRRIHRVPRIAVRILLVLLATVTIVLTRTRERGGRNETFGISSGTKIHFHLIPL
jgi:hypothetical protein